MSKIFEKNEYDEWLKDKTKNYKEYGSSKTVEHNGRKYTRHKFVRKHEFDGWRMSRIFLALLSYILIFGIFSKTIRNWWLGREIIKVDVNMTPISASGNEKIASTSKNEVIASKKIGNVNIILVKGDIVIEDVDVIVNAANKKMLGGGGIDGNIHDAAGNGLVKECEKFPENDSGVRCPTGEAKITGSYNITNVKHIIHAVGPGGCDSNKEELLGNAYSNSLKLAHDNGLTSITFPTISTGIFGYPIGEATEIAMKSLEKFIDDHPNTTLQDIPMAAKSGWVMIEQS